MCVVLAHIWCILPCLNKDYDDDDDDDDDDGDDDLQSQSNSLAEVFFII